MPSYPPNNGLEYDPEVDNIDDIIHSHDPFGDAYEEEERPAKKKSKINMIGTITKKELEEMSDDDAIIDLFLKNPDRFTVCEFYKRGNCKFGDNCKYYHPEEHEYEEKARIIQDEECCICLELVLKNER